jgi:hypothetical protein
MADYQPFSKCATLASPLVGAGLGSLIGGIGGYYSDKDPRKRRRNALIGALGAGTVGGISGLAMSPAEAARLPKMTKNVGSSAINNTLKTDDPNTYEPTRSDRYNPNAVQHYVENPNLWNTTALRGLIGDDAVASLDQSFITTGAVGGAATLGTRAATNSLINTLYRKPPINIAADVSKPLSSFASAHAARAAQQQGTKSIIKRLLAKIGVRAATRIGTGAAAGSVAPGIGTTAGAAAGTVATVADLGRMGTEELYLHKLFKGNNEAEEAKSLRNYALKYFKPNHTNTWTHRGHWTMGEAQQIIDDYVNDLKTHEPEEFANFMKDWKNYHENNKRGLWGWWRKQEDGSWK